MSIEQRAPGWKYNLSSPNSAPQPLNALHDTPSPNHISTETLEFPRSSFRIRGFGLLGGLLIFTMNILLLAFIVYDALILGERYDTTVMTASLSGIIIILWLIIPVMRLDFKLPRDEPIRFNRLRRKVYFYQYRYDRIRIFSRSRWGVKPVAYDWDDLIAEACSVYAPMGNGGLIENVTIAVRKPGTDEIIDRLFFTHDIELGKQYWAIAQLFMQQGPEALPKFVHPPRDWNNDAEISFIRRLAPKVKWPEAIDLESRTAPAAGETP
ncbi:DUF6708 domain-containing protein [Pseudomonas sp. microsymbiont 2]